MDARVGKLIEIAKAKYDNGDPSHDFAHIMRVVATCRRIGALEGADLDVLLPAALLHDVVNVPKNHPDRARASEMAAAEARRILSEVEYTLEEIERISLAIVEHSYSLGRSPSTIESAVLQDADRLDALGAIGLLRMATVGARLGRSFYDPADPLAENRPLDDGKYTIDHMGVKLFKLVDKMNTESARAEARRRAAFMRNFLEQLESEV